MEEKRDRQIETVTKTERSMDKGQREPWTRDRENHGQRDRQSSRIIERESKRKSTETCRNTDNG